MHEFHLHHTSIISKLTYYNCIHILNNKIIKKRYIAKFNKINNKTIGFHRQDLQAI